METLQGPHPDPSSSFQGRTPQDDKGRFLGKALGKGERGKESEPQSRADFSKGGVR
jgi:hypothetical protein